MARNRVIGRHNKLPWNLPADLKHFKSLTMGHTIIMGRKTYESIGRPLSGRTNIIITHQRDLEVPGAIIVHSIEEALEACIKVKTFNQEYFVIGGENIFQQMLKICKRMYITEIIGDFEGDTYFPEFDFKEWNETQRDKHFPDKDINVEYHFVTLDRKI